MRATLLVFLSTIGIAAFGQNVNMQSIQWSASQAVDLRTSASRTQTFEITTSPTQVKVVQGTTVKTFSVISTTGTWANVSANGSVQYQLSFNGKLGKALLQRVGGQASFTLDFSAHKDGFQQQFIIANYQVK